MQFTFKSDTSTGYDRGDLPGVQVEVRFEAECLDTVLEQMACFVRGAGFVIDAHDVLEFIPPEEERGEEIVRLRARVEELEEAARPFAEIDIPYWADCPLSKGGWSEEIYAVRRALGMEE